MWLVKSSYPSGNATSPAPETSVPVTIRRAAVAYAGTPEHEAVLRRSETDRRAAESGLHPAWRDAFYVGIAKYPGRRDCAA